MKKLLVIAAALALATPAAAKPLDANGNKVIGTRPADCPNRWCMCWLRKHLHIPTSAFKPGEQNLARAGRYIGAPARDPAIGVIVVWMHHVGIITGKTASGWIVKSGNDGHAVRERPRSLRGAIAFRWPHMASVETP